MTVEPSPSTSKFHFLYRLDCVGTQVRDRIVDTYYGIIAHLMTNATCSHATRLFLLDLCNIEATQQDLYQMHKVGMVPFLAKAMVEPLVAFAGYNKGT